MCGIAGIWHSYKESSNELIVKAKCISDGMIHRGPDDSGLWIKEKNGICFAHRRLSIVDLSKAGSQPMTSLNKRFTIVFNGEIYNNSELRIDLQNSLNSTFPWRGNSDTETFLESINKFGLINTLNKSYGMFSFALWDEYKKELFLARDRFGEKPLYWGNTYLGNENNKKILIFSSELAGIFKLKGFRREVDLDALNIYFKYGYIHGEKSIQKDIYRLGPGELLRIKANDDGYFHPEISKPYKWWDTIKSYNSAKTKYLLDTNFQDESYLIDYLENNLTNVIKEHANNSDVPIGTFLSGGIDSSLVTTLLQKESSLPIRSFTLKFEGFEDVIKYYDESIFAKKIANHLGTDHEEVSISPKEVLDIIPSLGRIYSEPFSDSSQVPTYLICKFMKSSGVSVALSGDGADELFGGYNRHILIPEIKKYFKFFPKNSKKLLINLLKKYPFSTNGLAMEKFQKLSSALLTSGEIEDIYDSIKSIQNYSEQEFYLHNNIICNDYKNMFRCKTIEETVMIADTTSYLNSDILVKLDRASMSSSLETRVPFLDKRVAEIAWLLPLSLKIRKTNGKKSSKWVLRKILNKYIPDELFNRPKKGFAMPISPWIKGPLKDWAKSLLSYDAIKKQGYINPDIVEKILNNHLEQKEDNSSRLWNILMWQLWLEEWK